MNATREMAIVRASGLLSAKAPFSFERSLAFINGFAPAYGEQRVEKQLLTKAIMMDGYTVAFQLTDKSEPDKPRLEYQLYSEQPLPDIVQRKVADRIAFFLSLDDDLTPFYALAEHDTHFVPILKRLYGLHHVKFLTLCEAACWAILSQHQPIPVSRKLKQKLTEAFGDQISVGGQTYWAFPEWDRLLGLSVNDLMALINNERRATYLYNAIHALSGVDETWLRTAPYAEADAWLRKIKGIGEWSAVFILLRALGRMEHLLLNMKPFLEILPKVYGPDATMAELADYYGEYVGYWSVYLRAAH